MSNHDKSAYRLLLVESHKSMSKLTGYDAKMSSITEIALAHRHSWCPKMARLRRVGGWKWP